MTKTLLFVSVIPVATAWPATRTPRKLIYVFDKKSGDAGARDRARRILGRRADDLLARRQAVHRRRDRLRTDLRAGGLEPPVSDR